MKCVNASLGYDGSVVADKLDFTISSGDYLCILGENGSGKSTLIKAILGLKPQISGEIEWCGDVKKNEIGYLPQQTVVQRDFPASVREIVRSGCIGKCGLRPFYTRKEKELAEDTIKQLGIEQLAKRCYRELSGGQQQRVALARALVGKPSLMLLDEPLSNLDANLREEMRFEIKELQRKLGVTVLYVTHDQEIGLAISDRVAIMDENGVIQQIGTPWEIFEQPANPFVFNFMGIANFIDVRRDGTNFFVGKGTQPMPWDEKPEGKAVDWVAAFRPSDVTISHEDKGLHGIVRRANFLGAMMDYLIEIDGAFLRTSLETHHAIARDLILKAGDTINVQFLALHWFEKETLKGVRNE